MWNYEKRLQFPVKIKTPDAKTAQIIMSQYGGPDGEISASLRYLSQRYAMPNGELAGLLTDVGTEELAHMEMVGAIVHQLTRNLTEKQIEEQGFSAYYTDHALGIWPQSAGGIPNNALTYASKGNTISDLNEDLAAEQKARATYDNILKLIDNPDVIAPIRFLREREVVHYQRFGEALDRFQNGDYESKKIFLNTKR
jgi:spore coat protein JC